MVNICRKYSKKIHKIASAKGFFQENHAFSIFPFFRYYIYKKKKWKNGKNHVIASYNMNYLLFIFFYRQRQVEKKNFPFFLFFHVYVY